jgi:hypothetical protein
MSVVSQVRPVSERIACEIFDRLQLLAAQYSVYTPVSEVIRPTRMGGYTPKHLQMVLTQNDPEVDSELGCPGNPPATALKILFNIRCHVMPSEKDITVVDEIINTFDADVVRVITDPDLFGTQWHTMGGLAIDAEFQTRESIDSDGSFAGTNIPLLVTYRTDENNPYNVRA